jgi:hypothetical protein
MGQRHEYFKSNRKVHINADYFFNIFVGFGALGFMAGEIENKK